jgi:hypothetical protein
MSVTVRWHGENQRIIYYEFVGSWTWAEFEPAYDETIRMMDSVDHRIDFILDMLKVEHIPAGAIQRLKRAADFNHPNMGLAVYVGLHPMIVPLGRIFLKLYPKSATFYPVDLARTITEAEAILAERQKTNSK